MIAALVLFGVAIACLLYGLGVGIYWINLGIPESKRAEAKQQVEIEEKRVERDNRLYDSIERLIAQISNLCKEIREDRHERNK